MSKLAKSRWVSLLLITAAAFVASPLRMALAHGHIEVGEYALVVGFRNEPALAGEPNGLELVVTHHETGEPIVGLDETINAEIIYGKSRRELDIRPAFGEDGAYTADVLPTEPGDYTFHLWGEIEGTEFDESLTSGPDTFSSVASKDTISFPRPDPAAQQAKIALWVGAAGTLLGLAGLAVGVFALRAARSS